jgi:hypothetical protein
MISGDISAAASGNHWRYIYRENVRRKAVPNQLGLPTGIVEHLTTLIAFGTLIPVPIRLFIPCYRE